MICGVMVGFFTTKERERGRRGESRRKAEVEGEVVNACSVL